MTLPLEARVSLNIVGAHRARGLIGHRGSFVLNGSGVSKVTA
jgi:hypothetical protein